MRHLCFNIYKRVEKVDSTNPTKTSCKISPIELSMKNIISKAIFFGQFASLGPLRFRQEELLLGPSLKAGERWTPQIGDGESTQYL